MGDTLAGSTLKVRPWPLGSATSTSATSAAARAPAIPVARENAVACGPVPVARWTAAHDSLSSAGRYERV